MNGNLLLGSQNTHPFVSHIPQLFIAQNTKIQKTLSVQYSIYIPTLHHYLIS